MYRALQRQLYNLISNEYIDIVVVYVDNVSVQGERWFRADLQLHSCSNRPPIGIEMEWHIREREKRNGWNQTTHGWVARWNEGQQLCRTLLFLSSKIFTESLNKMAYMEKYFHSTLDYIFIDQIKLGGHRPTLGDDIMSPAPVDHHHHQHKSHRLHKCDGSYTRPERTYNNTPRKVFIQDSYDWVIYIYNQRVYYYWLYDYYRCV